MSIFWQIVGAVGLAIQLYVIHLMTKGLSRSYPWVFLYLLVLFLTGVADFAGIVGPNSLTEWYARVYYINNTLRHLTGFLAVVSLFLIATRDHPQRDRLRTRVLAALVALMVLSFVARFPGFDNFEQNLPGYLGVVGRDMGFLTALLILTLWFALIRQRSRSSLLFLISSGMGLNMTGEAMSVSISVLSDGALDLLANIISVGSHFLCLLIWIHALRLAERRRQSAGIATRQ